MKRVGLKQRNHWVERVLVEPGQYLPITKPGPINTEDHHVVVFNILAPPPPGWKPSGRPDKIIVFLGDMPQYIAPVDVFRAEWQRYSLGQDTGFLPITIPVRQNFSLRLEGTEAVVVDVFFQTTWETQ